MTLQIRMGNKFIFIYLNYAHFKLLRCSPTQKYPSIRTASIESIESQSSGCSTVSSKAGSASSAQLWAGLGWAGLGCSMLNKECGCDLVLMKITRSSTLKITRSSPPVTSHSRNHGLLRSSQCCVV